MRTPRPSISFILSAMHGDPPMQASGVAIAAPGQTMEDLEREVREMYGARIVKLEAKPPVVDKQS